MLPPRPPHPPGARPRDIAHVTRASGSQPHWSDYFCERDVLDTPRAAFNCYFAGNWNPPLPTTTQPPPTRNILIICLHGAGHTGLSYAILAKALADKYNLVAYDARGHGLTHSSAPHDLSIQTMVEDGAALVEAVWDRARLRLNPSSPNKDHPSPNKDHPSPNNDHPSPNKDHPSPNKDHPSSTVLVGHSMGGAVAARVTRVLEERGRSVLAVVLLDVVEGIAMEAMSANRTFISHFPKRFRAPEEAIEWSLRSTLRCRESAEISVPSQLKEDGDGWTWRVNLEETTQYWTEWFKDLDDIFLSVNAMKVLLLAGTPHERLDKKLTVAHMQGKFQLQVIPKTGHIIQEDQSLEVAEFLHSLLTRFIALMNLNK